MSPKPLLEIQGLGVTLGGQRILEDVALRVQPGTIHALAGPNGGGKTTLIRCLLGELPHRGTIRLRWRGEGRIGYVPQSLRFDPALPMTVQDLFLTMLRRQPVFARHPADARHRVRELLELTQCTDVQDRRLGKLSGGEMRRVLLAQSLAPRPELLVLDEPASNVDQQGSRLFEQLLGRLRDEGLTILMVEHDMPLVLRLADHITGINRRVTTDGTPQDLAGPGLLERLFHGQAPPDPSRPEAGGLEP